MRNYTFFTILFIFYSFNVFSQTRTTITLTSPVVSVTSYTDKEVVINGATQLHLTGTTNNLLKNSIVNLNSPDAWLFVNNERPQYVIDSLLSKIYINGEAATYRGNCRVAIYTHGAVVIPQAPSYKPLTVYTEQNFGGNSTNNYSLFAFNKSLGAFDNAIRSFKLKRGYMATFATSDDGTGYSRVFIADAKDLEVSIMPDLLDKKISFIRVVQWEWVTKKGWAGYNTADYIPLKTTWRYDWNVGGSTDTQVEYVPIRQNAGWPSWTDINNKEYVSHVLGYNEPDHTEQSNVTVSEALAQWSNMMKSGLRIGSPACTNFSWLYQFLDSCKAYNYRVDFVAIHAYWGGKSPANWYNDLKDIHERTGRPIWITEWNNGANWTKEGWPDNSKPLALTPANAAKQLADIKAILQVLDTASFIERYSIYNWVEDARAMVLNGVLTPAGQYYANDTSVMAYNQKYEVIPGFVYRDPSLSIAFGTKTYSLVINDPNGDNYVGAIIERKVDDGDFEEIYNTDNPTEKTYVSPIDNSLGSRVRYRIRSKFANGNLSNYSNEVGYDVSEGSDNIQYGKMLINNINWNPLFYKNEYSAAPNIILGAVTNKNPVLLVPRAKIISSKTRVNLQVIPWSYQNVTDIANEETLPYFVLPNGNFDFGGLKAQADKINIGGDWTDVTFSTPFDTVPVVFLNQILASTSYATVSRVRNITKTGFQAKIQKEEEITSTVPTQYVSYLAITPGTGVVDGKEFIVGSTADNFVGSIYRGITYGDSIGNPIFISQLQTCHDDVTAGLRVLSIYDKYANVVKQREKSAGVSTQGYEQVGWFVFGDKQATMNGLNDKYLPQLSFYPNPVTDKLYLTIPDGNSSFVSIYNLLGVKVKSLKLTTKSIDVKDLPSGVYFIAVDGYKTTKFSKY